MTNETIIGVDLGGTNVRAGRVRDGKIEASVSRRISAKESESVILDEILGAIDEVFDREVAGIGFCVPTVVDVEKGIVYDVENIPSWREVHLKGALERRYGVQAHINNDANAFVVGELYFGKARGLRNVVGIVIGTGLGAGIVIEGKLYSGTNCGAGEIGTIPYRGSTIERRCAGEYLRRESGVDGETLCLRARTGDPSAIALFDSVGTTLGDAILIALYAYDPEMVVLGGSVSKSFAMFETAMRKQVATFAFRHALDRLQIVTSEIQDIAILGAAAIYLDAAR